MGEVETYLLFARDLHYIDEENFLKLDNGRQEVAKLLRGLIKSLVT